MNINIAKKRYQDVFRVDSIAVNDWDFMATHIPFKQIIYRTTFKNNEYQEISEEKIFHNLFLEEDKSDKHQFIVVDGSSGSGKSHFIRWIDAQLKVHELDNNNEILLIRRSDNTLKGTIRQLLELDTIKALKDNERYKRLIKANQTISESKFKDEILFKFVIELNDNDANDIELSSLKRKRLAALLKNDMFSNKMKSLNGPIDRIYSKIVHSENTDDSIPLFNKNDFIIDVNDPDFNFEYFLQSADKDAVSIAKKFISDDDSLDVELINDVVKCLNSLVDKVIQSCAGIEEGDFEQIFKEIRQSMYEQNKNLILLIEDITSCTGINKELLNVLITDHKGANAKDKMCRLISIIGTTTQYYENFRSNYIDRITTQITIQDGAIGSDKNDLYLFFAKYLNATSIDETEIIEWFRNGAIDIDMPVYTEDRKWESIDFCGKKLSLYPFTEQSISNLYSVMESHRTPRYILKEIIAPAVIQIIYDEKNLMDFITFTKNPIKETIRGRIQNTINELKLDTEISKKYAERAVKFIGFWGNNKLSRISDKIIGIKKKVYEAFGFERLYNYLIKTVDLTDESSASDVDVLPMDTPKDVVKENSEYISNYTIISLWYNENETIQKPRYLLEALKTLIIYSINWQQYGVSNREVDFLSKDITMFGFEGQGQGTKDVLINLKRNKETYELFLAVIQWDILGNKSWNFENNTDALYYLTFWINKHLIDIIKQLRNKIKYDKHPKYIEIAIVCEVYRKILVGDILVDKIGQINVSDILGEFHSKSKNQHSEEWKNLVDEISKNNDKSGKDIYDLIIKNFNLTQGSGSTVKFIDYYKLEMIFTKLKNQKFVISDAESFNSKFETEIYLYYKKIYNSFTRVKKAELELINSYLKKTIDMIGIDVDFGIEFNVGDVKSMLEEIISFYTNMQNAGLQIDNKIDYAKELKSKSPDIANSLNKIAKYQDRENLLDNMIYLSSIDLGLVISFVAVLEKMSQTIELSSQIIDSHYEAYIKKGNWTVDPRFDSFKNQYEDAIIKLEGLDE